MRQMDSWETYRCGTLIIGSGCAGFNAADTLYDLGYRDILMVTEGIRMGTSRNTGSDKQTYYKLAVQSGEADSVDKMTETLFSGKSVNGDTALAEAVNSLRCFMKLVNLGIPFPTNSYGEFVGYQTDHSTEKRATSAGPLTSKYMTEALEEQVHKKGISIMDHVLIVELIRDVNGILGAIGIQKDKLSGPNRGFTVFLADHVILATGGPASVYQNSVYPPSQTGMTGMAVEAGAECANLEEWQYGIASADFRWNLSGTYQQVIPRYISVDETGREHEFLHEYFEDPKEAMNLVFRKGYQWPFDAAKLNGSSVIDMLVWNEEMNRKRKVYLDFRKEPVELINGLESLSGEAYQYLKNSNALLTLPIRRLEKMNQPAIALFQSHGIDLYREPLRITVAAQHNNGGIAVDANWETSIPGLYAVGEAAGTFGVYRPGGSALNACQVGSLRAAEHISRSGRKNDRSAEQLIKRSVLCSRVFQESRGTDAESGKIERIKEMQRELAYGMSAYGAHLRNAGKLEELREKGKADLVEMDQMVPRLSGRDLPIWFKTRDMMVTQQAVIASMLFCIRHIGSRGGAAACEKEPDCSSAAAIMRMPQKTTSAFDDQILIYTKNDGCSFRQVRPIPKTNRWFEQVWNEYNEMHRLRTEK